MAQFAITYIPLWASVISCWLNGVGDVISILFLFVFGLFFNIHLKNILTSFKSYLSRTLIHKNFNPIFMLFIGVLFALSLLLGDVFMLGMMMSAGLNGLVVSILIQRADRILSFLFSGMASIMIASFSLIIGIINYFKMFNYA